MAAAEPNDRPLKVFISYARADMADADVLADTLERHAVDALIDRRDLPYGEAWQRELSDMIRSADAVVWLVTPRSLQSKSCRWELGELARHNKRLVPILIEHVGLDDLPPELGAIQLLPSEGTFELDRHLGALLHTLRTDIEWIKEHTRLTEQARQWSNRGRGAVFLLRGAELRAAQDWLQQRKATSPSPGTAVLELVLASRRAAARRRRWAIGGPLLAMLVIGLAYLALLSSRTRVLRDANIAMGDIENPATGDNGYDLSTVACNWSCLLGLFPAPCVAFTYDRSPEPASASPPTVANDKSPTGAKRPVSRKVEPDRRARCFPKYEASFHWNPSRTGSQAADTVLMPGTTAPSLSNFLMVWYRSLTGEPVDFSGIAIVSDSVAQQTDEMTGRSWFSVGSGSECMKVCNALGDRCAGFTYSLTPRRCEVFAKVTGVLRDAERRSPVYFSNAISACRDPKDCTASTQ